MGMNRKSIIFFAVVALAGAAALPAAQQNNKKACYGKLASAARRVSSRVSGEQPKLVLS
jgi:hypothetical protein